MKKIQINAAKLQLNKEKITSLSSDALGKIQGGDMNETEKCHSWENTCPYPSLKDSCEEETKISRACTTLSDGTQVHCD